MHIFVPRRFSTLCEKNWEVLVNLVMYLGVVWDVIAYLRPLAHVVHHVAESMAKLIVWVSGWRYATASQTASNYITRSTRSSRFFLHTLKSMHDMGRPGYIIMWLIMYTLCMPYGQTGVPAVGHMDGQTVNSHFSLLLVFSLQCPAFPSHFWLMLGASYIWSSYWTVYTHNKYAL